MLTTQVLPSLIHGTRENGNKELTISEALINIGVFNDNRAAFDHGFKIWRGRPPAYIYLKTDGETRRAFGLRCCFVGQQRLYARVGGRIFARDARDSGHTDLALSGMVDAAKTVRSARKNSG